MLRATWFSQSFSEVMDGRNSHLTDGVQRALGRAPRDFKEYVRDAAAAGFWQKQEVPTDWTFWNHVRTVAALLGAAVLTLALW